MRSLIYLELIFCAVWGKFLFFFSILIINHLSTIMKKYILSLLRGHSTASISQVSIYVSLFLSLFEFFYRSSYFCGQTDLTAIISFVCSRARHWTLLFIKTSDSGAWHLYINIKIRLSNFKKRPCWKFDSSNPWGW